MVRLTKQGVRDMGGSSCVSAIVVPYWFTCVVLLACRGARVEIRRPSKEPP